jgi:hypothetical protein
MTARRPLFEKRQTLHIHPRCGLPQSSGKQDGEKQLHLDGIDLKRSHPELVSKPSRFGGAPPGFIGPLSFIYHPDNDAAAGERAAKQLPLPALSFVIWVAI